jgi:hypothetical protein
MSRVRNAHGTGWSDARMPPNSVYVGREERDRRTGAIRFRESRWFNPFKIGRDGSREEVVAKYRVRLLRQPDLMAALPELRDKDLVCWCTPDACHAEVLLELANAPRIENSAWALTARRPRPLLTP